MTWQTWCQHLPLSNLSTLGGICIILEVICLHVVLKAGYLLSVCSMCASLLLIESQSKHELFLLAFYLFLWEIWLSSLSSPLLVVPACHVGPFLSVYPFLCAMQWWPNSVTTSFSSTPRSYLSAHSPKLSPALVALLICITSSCCNLLGGGVLFHISIHITTLLDYLLWLCVIICTHFKVLVFKILL